MRKTGNGTWRRQNLYCMINLPFFWVWKIGIGKTAQVRAQSISNQVPGKMYVVAVVNILFAYQIEQVVLKLTSWARVNFGGLTEVRFILPGILFPVLILLLKLLKNAFWVLVFLTVFYFFKIQA